MKSIERAMDPEIPKLYSDFGCKQCNASTLYSTPLNIRAIFSLANKRDSTGSLRLKQRAKLAAGYLSPSSALGRCREKADSRFSFEVQLPTRTVLKFACSVRIFTFLHFGSHSNYL